MAFIAGCDEVFRAIRISDGKEVFSVSSGAYTGASPALRSGMAYYGTFDNEVLGVSLGQKQVAWRYEHPQRKFPFYSSAAVTASRVVLGGRDKLVHGLTLNGKTAWTFTTRARVESSPAIAGGRVYIGSNDGRFYVLALTNWRQAVGIQCGRAALGFTGYREWKNRDWIPGRPAVLLWLVPGALYLVLCSSAKSSCWIVSSP